MSRRQIRSLSFHLIFTENYFCDCLLFIRSNLSCCVKIYLYNLKTDKFTKNRREWKNLCGVYRMGVYSLSDAEYLGGVEVREMGKFRKSA